MGKSLVSCFFSETQCMIDEASVTVWTTVGNITELIFEFYALRSHVSRVLTYCIY